MAHFLREYLRTAQDDEPTEALKVTSASSECSSSVLGDLPCPSLAIINNLEASSSRLVLHEVPVHFCFSGHWCFKNVLKVDLKEASSASPEKASVGEMKMVCGDDLPEKALSEALGHCGQSSWPFAEEDFEEDREVVVWEGWPEGLAISRVEEDIAVVDLGPDLEADYLMLSANAEEREPKYIVGLK